MLLVSGWVSPLKEFETACVYAHMCANARPCKAYVWAYT